MDRRIRLEAGEHRGAVRFLTALHVHLEEGKRSGWVTLSRVGTFSDPRYGEFSIYREMLLAMVENFKKRVYGQDIFIDVAHKPADGAAGKIVELALEGERLRGRVEWTDFGVEAIKSRGFAYLSIEYHENYTDNEQGAKHGPVLLGAGLTIRPVIKGLDPVTLSEDGPPTLLHPSLAKQLSEDIRIMWKEKLKQLREQLVSFKLAESVIDSLVTACEKALAAVTDESAAKALASAFETAGKQLAESIGNKPVPVQITMPAMNAGVSADDVKRILAESAAAEAVKTKQLAETLGAKKMLLADTINAATGIDEAMKKTLAEAVADLITGEWTDEQVRRLAASQLKQANELIAARQLAAMGWQGGPRPAGSPHIEVLHGNEIKELQETVDRRMGFERLSPSERFRNTGGVLNERNKKLADEVLAQFDAIHGRRLHAEHQQMKRDVLSLAAGTGTVSDIAIPAAFERTVIREALYDMVALQFMDVATDEFAAVVQIPYAFRDTTGAGRNATRVYEAQGIPRAGVRQTVEEFRPIPQKLSFLVSAEMQLLAANGKLNYDAWADNVRNTGRIVGEDTERVCFNEIVQASDETSVVALTNEALTAVNGTNRIFALTQFPVVRPRRVFDLKGAQQGTTVNPITVTYASVVRNEYDGSGTQAAGTYYVLDYNLGEIRFVSELGVLITPPNTTAITVSYSYSTNVRRWDSDLGALAVDAKYDELLYEYGLRKSIIEDQRFYKASMGLMSGTLMTGLERARQFAANFARAGTNLTTDGNLGVVKSVPNFKPYAPGLDLADQRIVIGQRYTSRLRMLKPWSMTEPQDARTAQGLFTAQREAYGTQWIMVGTPLLLKPAYSSIVIFSATGRVNRAN
jgi:Mu-like prophage I protein